MTGLYSLAGRPVFRAALAWIFSVSIVPWAARAVRAEAPAGGSTGGLEVAAGYNLLQDSPPGEMAISVDQLRFRDLDGQAYYVDHLRDKGPIVFLFLSTRCPVVKQYTQRLIRLYETFRPTPVQFFAVFSNQEDDRSAIREYLEETRLPMPVVADRSGDLARRLGATMTPQALVLDPSGKLVYRGGIDDHRYPDRVKRHFLLDALSAVVAERPVPVAQSRALGCSIHLEDPAGDGPITYSRHIARILQDNCQVCHREGEIAPFPLTSYDHAKTWATEIAAYTQKRLMPPWKPVPEVGHFQGNRSLSQEHIDLIRRWVEGGTPLGDPDDAPPAPRYDDEWALGPPDMIVEMPVEYVIGPEGEDVYRHFIIPSNFPEDRYIEAVDVKPGNRHAVHHVLIYTDTHGKARELDAKDPGPGYTSFGGPGFEPDSSPGGWAPGTVAQQLPPGTGHLLPQGADIVLQVHYYRTGVEERDRTRVGFYFSDAPRPAVVATPMIVNTEFELPPGDPHHKVTATLEVSDDLYALSVFPHMHFLGTEIKVELEKPDGQVVPMVWINDWDFQWQQWYTYEDPMFLPKGSKVHMTAYYDNSADNPDNPNDPPRPVHWGDKSTDEMALTFLTVVRADQWKPAAQEPPATAAADN